MIGNQLTLPPISNFEQALNQINLLLTRFNFSSVIFQKEINYLLTHSASPWFSPSHFTTQLLKKLHHLLILETWNPEPHHLTNTYQVRGIKRLLRILDLNNFCQLASQVSDTHHDPWPYQLTREKTTRSLLQLVGTSHSSHSNRQREPAEIPPTTRGSSYFRAGFYRLPYQSPLSNRNLYPPN